MASVLSFLSFSLFFCGTWQLSASLGTHTRWTVLSRGQRERKKERKKKLSSSSSSSITETRNYQLVVTRANPFSFLASRFDLKLFVCWLLSVVVFFFFFFFYFSFLLRCERIWPDNPLISSSVCLFVQYIRLRLRICSAHYRGSRKKIEEAKVNSFFFFFFS